MVSDNLNGHMSEERLKLLPDGKMDDGVSTAGRWEHIGTSVRIALNDKYAVYLGTRESLGSSASGLPADLGPALCCGLRNRNST